MLLPLLALALTSPRIAILPIAPGEGVSDKTAGALTEALAAEVRRRAGAGVISQREIDTLLSLERQRAMMGCSNDACMAELGGALGVEELTNGDIALVGESLLVHLRRLEVTKVRVLAQADRRFRKGTLDDVLDALPAMVGELYPAKAEAAGSPPPPPSAPPESGTAAGPPPARGKELPPPWVEEPDHATRDVDLAKVSVWEDGSGHYVATDPKELSDTFFAGTARKLHSVHLGGGGIDGGTETGHKNFWEPRVRGYAEFRWSPEGATLDCGGVRTAFRRVPALEAKKLLARAQLLAPRWRRIPYLLARDDQGVYFYVDGKRGPDGFKAEPADLRLYAGKKGAMAPIELQDVIQDDAGFIFVTAGGRLVARGMGKKYAVEWATASARIALSSLDPADNAPLIYRELGVYAGQQLGTPCDGRL